MSCGRSWLSASIRSVQTPSIKLAQAKDLRRIAAAELAVLEPVDEHFELAPGCFTLGQSIGDSHGLEMAPFDTGPVLTSTAERRQVRWTYSNGQLFRDRPQPYFAMEARGIVMCLTPNNRNGVFQDVV